MFLCVHGRKRFLNMKVCFCVCALPQATFFMKKQFFACVCVCVCAWPQAFFLVKEYVFACVHGRRRFFSKKTKMHLCMAAGAFFAFLAILHNYRCFLKIAQSFSRNLFNDFAFRVAGLRVVCEIFHSHEEYKCAINQPPHFFDQLLTDMFGEIFLQYGQSL